MLCPPRSYQHIPRTALSFAIRQRCRLFMSNPTTGCPSTSNTIVIERDYITWSMVSSPLCWWFNSAKGLRCHSSTWHNERAFVPPMSFDDGVHHIIHFVPPLMLFESARNHDHQDLTTGYSPIAPPMEVKPLIYQYQTNSKSTFCCRAIITNPIRTIVR